MNDKLGSTCEVSSYNCKRNLNENYERCRYGVKEWKNNSLQKYYGDFYQNNLHNEGHYSSVSSNKSYLYEGSLYAGNFDGYARVTQSDCTYFEGLFKCNKRYGPGILTHYNGHQDVGIWDGLNLIRLGTTVLPEWVPKLGTTGAGKVKLLKYRKLVSLNDDNDQALNIMQKITNDEEYLNESYKLYNGNIKNDKSMCFDKPNYDLNYFGDQNYCYIDVPINPEEIYLKDSNTSFMDINDLNMDEVMCFILNNMERFENLTSEENELITIKSSILEKLTKHDIDLKRLKEYTKINTKKVIITNILAWNNEENLMNILKHTFKHRSRENIVQFGVSDIIIGNRNLFSKPSRYERACISFLFNSSEGNEARVVNLFHEFKLNPDLSDVAGNSAIMFASARDHIRLIRELTQLGANLDKVNDESLSPLSMVLLRYIATLNKIKNWESAFLGVNNSFIDSPSTNDLNTLNGYEPKNKNSLDVNLYNDFNILRTEVTDLQWLYNKLEIESPTLELQNFQEPYHINYEYTSYVFDNKIVSSQKKNKKLKKPKKPNDEDLLLLKKLEVIYNTFVALLYYGADGNIGEVPYPPIILSIYTENEKILNKLIESGVKINITTEQGLTVLHTLLTLPLKEYLLKFCEILLKNGADPNLRTSIDHWEHEKEILKSNYNESFINDFGKTGLNIIGLRPDFRTDYSDILGKLTELLLEYGACVDDKYLGHTTLSLAILKGNIKLVENLLTLGSNPNEILEYNMGTPFTIYALSRYSKIIPKRNICENILNLLMQYFANPLNEVYNFGNALEFAINEKKEKIGSSKKSDKVKSVKGKGGVWLQIKEIMLTHLRNSVLKHQTFKAIVVLIKAILGDFNIISLDDFYKNIANIITLNDAMNSLQILLDSNYLNLENELHNKIINLLLNHIYQNGFDIDFNNIDLVQNSKKLEKYKNCYNVELDNEEVKYIICFYCGLRTDKILLPCPKCGLIYYCSQECNSLGNKLKTQHSCKILFYNEEKKKYDKCIALGIMYISPLHHKFQTLQNLCHDLKNQIKKLEKNPDVYNKLLQNLTENINIDFLNKEEGQIIDKFGQQIRMKTSKNNRKDRIGRSRSRKADSERSKSDKTRTKSDTTRSNSEKTSSKFDKTRSKSSKTRSKSSKTRSKSTKSSSTRSEKKTKGSKSKKDRSRSMKISGKSKGAKTRKGRTKSRTSESKKRLKFSKDVNLGQSKSIKDQQRSTEKTKAIYKSLDIFNKYEDKNKFIWDFDKENLVGAKYISVKESGTDIKKLTPQQRAFIDKLAQFFPELDFTSLFVPFVCFNEGQFYYRFTDAHPFFCPSYTGV